MLTSAWLVCCEKYRAQPVLHTLLAKLQYASEGTNCRIELQIRKYCTRTTEKTIRAGETWRERYCSCYRVRRLRPKPKTIPIDIMPSQAKDQTKSRALLSDLGARSAILLVRPRAAAVPVCRMFLSRKKRTEDFPSTDGRSEERERRKEGRRRRALWPWNGREGTRSLCSRLTWRQREILQGFNPGKDTKAQLIFL